MVSIQLDIQTRIEKEIQETGNLKYTKDEYCQRLQINAEDIMEKLGKDLKLLDTKIDRYEKGESLEDIEKPLEQEASDGHVPILDMVDFAQPIEVPVIKPIKQEEQEAIYDLPCYDDIGCDEDYWIIMISHFICKLWNKYSLY